MQLTYTSQSNKMSSSIVLKNTLVGSKIHDTGCSAHESWYEKALPESMRDKTQFCTKTESPVIATFQLNNVPFSSYGKGETNLKVWKG